MSRAGGTTTDSSSSRIIGRAMSRRTLLESILALAVAGWFEFQSLSHRSTAISKVARRRTLVRVIDRRRMMNHVSVLAQPEWEGRLSGSPGEAKAGEYIAQEWQKRGLLPAGEGGTFFQSFPIPTLALAPTAGRMRLVTGEASGKKADNVIAFLPGRDPDLRQEVVVISAHYDHLGHWGHSLYPGANDNASGVAVILELARFFSGSPLRRSLAFFAFSGEEAGLLGSRYFLANPTIELSRIVAVLNLDSIANGQPDDFIYWTSANLPWRPLIEQKAQETGIKIKQVETNGHSSDHRPFMDFGIPAVTVLSATWLEDNHLPIDRPDMINPDKMGRIAMWSVRMLKALAEGN